MCEYWKDNDDDEGIFLLVFNSSLVFECSRNVLRWSCVPLVSSQHAIGVFWESNVYRASLLSLIRVAVGGDDGVKLMHIVILLTKALCASSYIHSYVCFCSFLISRFFMWDVELTWWGNLCTCKPGFEIYDCYLIGGRYWLTFHGHGSGSWPPLPFTAMVQEASHPSLFSTVCNNHGTPYWVMPGLLTCLCIDSFREEWCHHMAHNSGLLCICNCRVCNSSSRKGLRGREYVGVITFPTVGCLCMLQQKYNLKPKCIV